MFCLALFEWLDTGGCFDETFGNYHMLGCMELIDCYYEEIGIYRD